MPFLIAFILLCLSGCASEPRVVDGWLTSSVTSPKQKWAQFEAMYPSDFMSRCVAPTMRHVPENGLYLQGHESDRFLLRYMKNNCYEEAQKNRAMQEFGLLKESHFSSWGFRLYFGRISNLTKQSLLRDLSGPGGDLNEDLGALKVIAEIWSDNGHIDSSFALAALLMTTDAKLSRELTEKAAIAGNCFAQAHLAYLYAAGIGGERDPVRAYFWYMTTRDSRETSSSMLSSNRDLPHASNYYPRQLEEWFKTNYGIVAPHRLPVDDLGRAISMRGDYFCRLPALYDPLPPALASSVRGAVNDWMQGQLPPPALDSLANKYRGEALVEKQIVSPVRSEAPEGRSVATSFVPSFKRLSFKSNEIASNHLLAEDLFDEVGKMVFPVYSALNELRMTEGEASTGSAVHIRDNYFLTNCHIFEGNNFHLISVGERVVGINFYSADFERDTCIFVVAENLGLPPLNLRPSSLVRIGEPIYAIGNPSGLARTLSNGLVSQKRQVNLVNVIQTNTEISSGSSGGGLFDQYGNLIGITSFGLKGAEGLNFAIAVEEFVQLP